MKKEQSRPLFPMLRQYLNFAMEPLVLLTFFLIRLISKTEFGGGDCLGWDKYPLPNGRSHHQLKV
ncbi:MAG TPA: hypothetical protein DD416_01865 [Rhodobacteraceae bacterium]|nr:hypothetical protein [Paracoccaceae bacterium]